MKNSSDEFLCLPPNQWPRDAAAVKLAVWKYVFAIIFLIAAFTANAVPPEDAATLIKNATTLHQQGDYVHSIPILRRVIEKGFCRDKDV